MPTLLIWHGYRFRFYSSDGSEPAHVHIVKDGKDAKVWLSTMELAYSRGYNARENAEFLAKIEENRQVWKEQWDEFFGI